MQSDLAGASKVKVRFEKFLRVSLVGFIITPGSLLPSGGFFPFLSLKKKTLAALQSHGKDFARLGRGETSRRQDIY